LEGLLAQSYEVAADGLQITFKLRPNAKWHPVDPVNSRAVDAEDVVFSLNRHAEVAPLRSLVWNAASPGGFALAPESPDSSTVVVKLTEPIAYAPNWFAAFGSFTGQILMFPKEMADPNVVDVRNKAIGTGPWYLAEHRPSIGFTLKRNEDYWDPDYALVDEIQMPIIPEYAARVSQLVAGEIHFASRPTDIVRATDVLQTKKDQEKLLMYESGNTPAVSVMTFGWQGEDRFKDERVRQAISMAFDRDLDIEVRYNADEFEKAGIPIRSSWNSHLGARDEWISTGWFLDPQGSEFGPNAQYFQYNLEEAKKLLAAAGHPDGFDMKFFYPNAPQFNRQSVVEPYHFYLQELGLNVIDAGQTDYTQDYIPNNRDASGAFDGLAYHSVTGTIPSVVAPTSQLVAEHLPSSGVTFHGYSLGGGGGKTGDPTLVEILEKAKIEQDIEAQKALVIEAQRHLGKAMWNLLEPGGATGYWFAWPAVKNFRVWESSNAVWEKYQIWLDTTQAPFV
jgi:ABC-type transport system substrate-binding protein